ncbi:MAG: TetR/AcrR family transcriptional regulator [Verrucomicrobiota bacterium]|nr:TetR/AcrR family transcriptional regulator [Verrucomicrobiota bacterium]
MASVPSRHYRMGRKSTARERLIEVALRCFWENGCASVSVDLICQKAGVNKGSFYHFFPSKTDLLLTTLDDFWTDARTTILEPAFDPQKQPFERIFALIDNTYNQQETLRNELGRTIGCPFCNLAVEMSNLEDIVNLRIESIFGRWELYIEGALQEAFVTGKFNGLPKPTAQVIYATLCGAILRAKVSNNPARILEIKPQVQQILGFTP